MKEDKLITVCDNPEDAEKSLEAIREGKKAVPKKKGLRRFFDLLKKPFVTLFAQLKKVRVPITVKTVIIYSLLFTVTLVFTVIFMIGSVENHLNESGVVDDGYITNLIVTGIILILIDVAIVVGLGAIASTVMMGPVRKMIEKIDDINPDDLTVRLDKVDSSGEIGELTDRINKMLDQIEQSVGRQKKFISDASHELKTPIAVIQGYGNLLQRWGKDDPEVLTEGIDSIVREAGHMKKITEQLLFLAKIGRFVLSYEDVELKNELTAIAESYAVVEKKRDVKVIAQSELTSVLDKNMLVECVRAVVDNAVKYSDEGTDVIIRLFRDGSDAVVSVEDSGCGISQEDLPHIFDRFYRCDKSRRRDKEESSCGLGLTIAKSVVEMMGGVIGVESEEGIGSTFILRFPLKEAENNE